eukprot:6486274-Amphidinium_carterae.1
MSPRGKLLEKARSWPAALDLSAILECAKDGKLNQVGTTVWQAEQTHKSLKITHAGSPETLLLGAHLQHAKTAQDGNSRRSPQFNC